MYILLKSMLIHCEHFIFKKIYYLEVHVQKTGQLHYSVDKLLNSVSDTFVIVVFERLLSHHIKKRR